MAKSTKTNFLDQLIGVKEPTMETMEHSQVLKQNLEAQMNGCLLYTSDAADE